MAQRGAKKWGSASGHAIPNEGEITYRFMSESGAINQGTTQIGDVRRPLAAVSKITAAKNLVFFSEEENWIIDSRDELAKQIVELVRRAKRKTKMYQHKGTYRMRAWLIPEKQGVSGGKGPFGGPGR